MKTKPRLASRTAAILPLFAGLAALAAALWLSDETGGAAGRGLVFIGFAGLMLGLYGTVKRLFPDPPRTTRA